MAPNCGGPHRLDHRPLPIFHSFAFLFLPSLLSISMGQAVGITVLDIWFCDPDLGPFSHTCAVKRNFNHNQNHQDRYLSSHHSIRWTLHCTGMLYWWLILCFPSPLSHKLSLISSGLPILTQERNRKSHSYHGRWPIVHTSNDVKLTPNP
jgi:hypothetical protein